MELFKINRKRIIIVASFCILICIITVATMTFIINHSVEITQMEAVEDERFRTAEAYFKLHYALRWTRDDIEAEGWEYFFDCDRLQEWALGDNIYYRSLQSLSPNRNPFGLESVVAYVNLKLYENRTGNILPYERILEYLSEEFEPDGSLRLYNNGKHPDVESFVNWSWGRREEQLEFIESLRVLLFWYFEDYAGDDFEKRSILHLSPQMLDALARLEADPTYVLDLTSLYRQGY